MHDAAQLARLLMEAATSVAQSTGARAILVAIDALPEVEAVPPRTILIVRDDHDRERAAALTDSALGTIAVPNVELNRIGQVKLAAIMALSHRLIELADSAVFLTGPYRAMVDSLVVMALGSEYEMFDSTDQPEIDEHIRRAVFHRVLSFALHLGQHGREGKRVGSLIVVGDTPEVLKQSEQLILNPFRGYPDEERNILNDRMADTLREFSALDGAIIVRGTGVVESAGAHLRIVQRGDLAAGLGARHAAAAGITATTRSVAFTVSQSDGTVRVWRAGKLVAAFEPAG